MITGELKVRTFDTIDPNLCVPDNKYQVSENLYENSVDVNWIKKIIGAIWDESTNWTDELESPSFGGYEISIQKVMRACEGLGGVSDFTHEFYGTALLYNPGALDFICMGITLENLFNQKAIGLSAAIHQGTDNTTNYVIAFTSYFYGLDSPNFISASIGTMESWNRSANSGDGQIIYHQKFADAVDLEVNPAEYQSSSVTWSFTLA